MFCGRRQTVQTTPRELAGAWRGVRRHLEFIKCKDPAFKAVQEGVRAISALSRKVKKKEVIFWDNKSLVLRRTNPKGTSRARRAWGGEERDGIAVGVKEPLPQR